LVVAQSQFKKKLKLVIIALLLLRDYRRQTFVKIFKAFQKQKKRILKNPDCTIHAKDLLLGWSLSEFVPRDSFKCSFHRFWLLSGFHWRIWKNKISLAQFLVKWIPVSSNGHASCLRTGRFVVISLLVTSWGTRRCPG